IGVDLEDAGLVLDEHEGERLEDTGGAEPDVFGLAGDEVGLEVLGVLAAQGAVDAVGADDQVGVPETEAGEVRVVLDVAMEAQVGAEPGGALLEDLQQLDPGEAGEAVAAGSDGAPLEVDVNVVPAGEAGRDLLERLGVGGLEVAEGLVGE